MNLNLKKPCKNCPFRKEGAIPLQPGRVEGIVAELARDHFQNFPCHKTTDGEYVEDEEGEEHYQATGKESACMGAIAYMLKMGRPSLGVRYALAVGLLDYQHIQTLNDEILDPPQGTEP